MICALWWAWVSTTWVTNWLDPVKLPVRGAVVALAFVVVRDERLDRRGVRRTGVDVRDRVRRAAGGAHRASSCGRPPGTTAGLARLPLHPGLDVAGAVLWITGALLPLSLQLPLWAAALGLELIGTILGYPGAGPRPGEDRVVGRLGSAHRRAHGPVRAHRARRGPARDRVRLRRRWSRRPRAIVAMIAAFVAAAATWWIYFDHGERIGAEAIEAADEPGRLAAHRVHLDPPRDHRRDRADERRRQGGARATARAQRRGDRGHARRAAALPGRHRALPARARAAAGRRAQVAGRRRHPAARRRSRRSSTHSPSRSPSRCCSSRWPPARRSAGCAEGGGRAAEPRSARAARAAAAGRGVSTR